MTRNAVFHNAGAFDDGAPITSFPGAIVSVFGRTGTVVATAGDYYAVLPAALTGATQAFRIAGATTSGAPVSGTFAVGDLVAARDGHLFMCISAGTPGTWVDTGGSVSFATPAIALGSSAAAGSAGTAIRSDSTIAAFDATSPTTQAFGDAAAVGTAAFAARRDHKHAMPAGLGLTQLVYRYIVAGTDKASIDTGADTAQAGSNDWTNGDMLNVYMTLRTDDAGATANATVTLNNDGTSIYDGEAIALFNVTLSNGPNPATAGWAIHVHGSGGSTGYPSSNIIEIPDYAGTTFWKVGWSREGRPDATAANNMVEINAVGYRSTSAITRLAVAASGSQKFKVGSQLLIYKILAS